MTVAEAGARPWTPAMFTGTPREVQLTPMQCAVLESLCEGKGTAGIREDYGITRNTVQTHVRLVLKAAGARDRVELVALVLSGAVRVQVTEPADHWLTPADCGRL